MSSCIVHTRISDCWYSFILLFFDVSGTWYTLGQCVAVLCTPEYQTADIHLSFNSFDVSGTQNTLGQCVAVLCTPESDCWYSLILLFFWCSWNLEHTWTMSSCIVHTRISDCWYSLILLFLDVSGTQNTLGQWVAVLCTPEYQTADIHLSFYSLMFLEHRTHLDNE